jgi:hypothetical protein
MSSVDLHQCPSTVAGTAGTAGTDKNILSSAHDNWVACCLQKGLLPMSTVTSFDVDPAERLLCGNSTFVPTGFCWFCHKKEIDINQEGGKLMQCAPFWWEYHPRTIWIHCDMCTEDMRKSWATEQAMDKKVQVTLSTTDGASLDTIHVMRSNGLVQGGWSVKFMHECWSNGSQALGLSLIHKKQDLTKGADVFDVLACNPGLVITPQYPAFYPVAMKEHFNAALASDVSRLAAVADAHANAAATAPVETA